MSVLAFPSSAAARNLQDLSHIFRDFRRPVPLFFARMEVVSRTAPRPVGLMRVAGLTPVVACLGRAGAPLTRLLQRVRLPACLFDRPEALIPTCQAARFIDEAASVEGFENVALVAGQGTPLEALGVFGRLVRRARTLHEALDTAIRNMPAFDSGSRSWLERQGGRARLCHELVDAIDGERRQAREYRSSLAMKLIGLAAGPSDDIQRREAAVSFPVSLLGRAVPPLSGQRTDDDIAAWEASAPAADFPGSVLQVIETLSFPHQPRIGLVANAIGISGFSPWCHPSPAGTWTARASRTPPRWAGAPGAGGRPTHAAASSRSPPLRPPPQAGWCEPRACLATSLSRSVSPRRIESGARCVPAAPQLPPRGLVSASCRPTCRVGTTRV